MKQLTQRQQQILTLIREHLRQRGAPPTRAELARLLGLRAASTVEQHLQALAAKGCLEIQPGLNRNLRLIGGDPAAPGATDDTGTATAPAGVTRTGGSFETHDVSGNYRVPLIGRVAAGAPVLATEHIERRYQLDPALFRRRPDYLLRVRGLSMRDAGILDGDLLAVHRVGEARAGQIVVARVDDEVTVKRFQPPAEPGGPVRLLPENPEFAPLDIDPARHEFRIEGVAVGVIRTGRF